MNKIIIFAASLCVASSALAGGYRVALQGQKATGMGHAGVAMTESSEVVFFNPAGMSFLASEMSLTAGITLIDGLTRYQNESTNTAAKTDSPLGTPVNLYFTRKQDEKLSYGIGLYTPYGNAVEWQKDWVGSHLVNNIELKTIYIQPTIAYQINDQYSVGFGPTYVTGTVDFNRNLSTSLVDANGNRSNVTISASNVNSWGYNLGFLAKPFEQLSIGISYRSKVDLEARNEKADFENIPASLSAAFPDTTFDADLVLPAELTIGIAYQLNQQTTLAFDLNRTYWSAFKNLDVDFDNAGAGLSLNPRNYVDVNIYRFGVQHKMDDALTVRGGIYLDDSPIKDGYFTPETARNDSVGLTAGASYKLSENMEIDGSFLYLIFDEFDGSYDHFNQSGTLIPFSGSYKTSATAIGFGLNYTF